MTVNNLISEALTPNAGITATESPHLAGTAFVFLVTHQSKQSWWFRVASASLRQGPSGHLRGASAERGKFTQRCDNKHRCGRGAPRGCLTLQGELAAAAEGDDKLAYS